MTASLNEKLMTVKWGEYKLSDLFVKKTIKGVPKHKENLTKTQTDTMFLVRILNTNIRKRY